MEESNGQPGAPDDGQGGLVTRERHVFKVPAPKTSLLGEQGCIAPSVGTCRSMQASTLLAVVMEQLKGLHTSCCTSTSHRRQCVMAVHAIHLLPSDSRCWRPLGVSRNL